jgi:hypothetical protein
VSPFLHKIKSSFSWERLAVFLILLLGFILRLQQYLTGRSLWLDEAMLALNIVNRDFAGLFQPLDYDQGAPIGFLLVEKIFNVMFGDHEFVLRFFPFVAGVAGLGLFYLLLRRTTSGIGLLTGLALFAFGPELVYYSSEMKQYILDVAVAISILLMATPIFEQKAKKRDFIYLGLVGILGLWFSHPALFMLAGIGIGLLIPALKQRERSLIISTLTLGVAWLANLGLLYLVSLRNLSQNTFLLEYWQENFMPASPWSNWSWFGAVFEDFIQHQVGVHISIWEALIILILGLAYLSTKNKVYSGVLFVIFIFELVASAVRLYPLGGRLSLFLAPLVLILISHAVDALEHRFHALYGWSKLIALFVGAYLLYVPVSESLSNFSNPKYFEHIRPSMATLSENWREGDALFVSYGAVPAFRFYADRYGLGDVAYQTSGAADYLKPEDIVSHLRALDGNSRVWVLVTHVYETKDFNEKDFLLTSFETMGDHKREFRSPGTSVYLNLYDLSP